MKGIFKTGCLAVGTLSVLFGIAPVLFGVINSGMVAMIIFGLLLLATTLLWNCIRKNDGRIQIERRLRAVSDRRAPNLGKPPKWWRILRAVTAGLLSVCFVAGLALSIPMAHQAYFTPPGEEPHTVVVLGCQILDDAPSLMLRKRLDTALLYLNAHPTAPVVVSGGMEPTGHSEAGVMRAYFLSAGIADNRIYIEEKSHNTKENLQYSAQVIAENQLPRQIAVATDGFHQFRAAIYASRNGLSAAALPSGTPWGLFPSYWVREMLGTVKAFVLD